MTIMGEPALLRWAGSKRKSLPHLLRYWQTSQKEHYVEPFCGSAALFFAASVKKATLSDKNEWLINFLKVVRRYPLEVYNRSASIPRTRERYNVIRETAKPSCTIESAANFIYLNRNCFNGIYRTNKVGHFNVPYSSSRTGEHPSRETFVIAADKLKDATLISGDFEKIVRKSAQRTSFVYLDPPYATNNSRVFTQYDSHSFGLKDIERLARLLDHLENEGAQFLVSYADVSEIQFLRKRWRSEAIEVQRHVSGFTAFRHRASELLISNLE